MQFVMNKNSLKKLSLVFIFLGTTDCAQAKMNMQKEKGTYKIAGGHSKYLSNALHEPDLLIEPEIVDVEKDYDIKAIEQINGKVYGRLSNDEWINLNGASKVGNLRGSMAKMKNVEDLGKKAISNGNFDPANPQHQNLVKEAEWTKRYKNVQDFVKEAEAKMMMYKEVKAAYEDDGDLDKDDIRKKMSFDDYVLEGEMGDLAIALGISQIQALALKDFIQWTKHYKNVEGIVKNAIGNGKFDPANPEHQNLVKEAEDAKVAILIQNHKRYMKDQKFFLARKTIRQLEVFKDVNANAKKYVAPKPILKKSSKTHPQVQFQIAGSSNLKCEDHFDSHNSGSELRVGKYIKKRCPKGEERISGDCPTAGCTQENCCKKKKSEDMKEHSAVALQDYLEKAQNNGWGPTTWGEDTELAAEAQEELLRLWNRYSDNDKSSAVEKMQSFMKRYSKVLDAYNRDDAEHVMRRGWWFDDLVTFKLDQMSEGFLLKIMDQHSNKVEKYQKKYFKDEDKKSQKDTLQSIPELFREQAWKNIAETLYRRKKREAEKSKTNLNIAELVEMHEDLKDTLVNVYAEKMREEFNTEKKSELSSDLRSKDVASETKKIIVDNWLREKKIHDHDILLAVSRKINESVNEGKEFRTNKLDYVHFVLKTKRIEGIETLKSEIEELKAQRGHDRSGKFTSEINSEIKSKEQKLVELQQQLDEEQQEKGSSKDKKKKIFKVVKERILDVKERSENREAALEFLQDDDHTPDKFGSPDSVLNKFRKELETAIKVFDQYQEFIKKQTDFADFLKDVDTELHSDLKERHVRARVEQLWLEPNQAESQTAKQWCESTIPEFVNLCVQYVDLIELKKEVDQNFNAQKERIVSMTEKIKGVYQAAGVSQVCPVAKKNDALRDYLKVKQLFDLLDEHQQEKFLNGDQIGKRFKKLRELNRTVIFDDLWIVEKFPTGRLMGVILKAVQAAVKEMILQQLESTFDLSRGSFIGLAYAKKFFGPKEKQNKAFEDLNLSQLQIVLEQERNNQIMQLTQERRKFLESQLQHGPKTGHDANETFQMKELRRIQQIINALEKKK